MQRTLRLVASLGAIAVLVTSACSDSTGPTAKPVEELTISGVRTNTTAFRDRGEFSLGLLATDQSGDPILSASVRVTADLTTVGTATSGFSLSTPQNTAEPAGTRATYASVLIDDSGSMSWSDPSELRADAAQEFWRAVLPVRSTNRVAVLDFGAGSTTGFTETRLLQDWTTSESLLQAATDRIVASGDTPLYESMRETATWMGQSAPANSNRVMLLLSDGEPNSSTNRDAAIAEATRLGITVHTVGLGPASEVGGQTSTSAVRALREVADGTQGVYASATSAAALGTIFRTLAQVSAQGQLLSTFRISPIPPSGTRISGTVTITSGGSQATATWSFIAP